MKNSIFENMPIWVIFFCIILVIIITILSGIKFSRWRKKHVGKEDDSPIHTIVGATLGLLGFILAFTFGLTSSRFEAKKHFLLEEVNSIETSWLRAGLVEEPYSTNIKKSIVDYVNVRISLNENPDQITKALKDSEILQNEIWSQVTKLTKTESTNAKINALLIVAVNDMFDNHTRRVSTGLIDRIPNLIWIALFALVIIAMFEVGYLLGKMEKTNMVLIVSLSMAFSVVIMIIVDLDSSRGNINNQAVYDLYDRINL